MICQKCGTEIPEGSLFCDKCGAPVEPEAQPETVPAAPAPKKKKTGCIIAAVIVAVLLLIPGIILLVGALIGLIVAGTFMIPFFSLKTPDVNVPVTQFPEESIVSTVPVETVPVMSADNPYRDAFPDQEWALQKSDIQDLTAKDLKDFTARQLIVARNEIYARHGVIFSTPDLQEYFSSKSWYVGSVLVAEFDADELNEYERRNIQFIQLYEMRAEPGPLSEYNPYKAVYENHQYVQYVYKHSSERKLADYELRRLTKEELIVAYSEIYARHGYAFTDEDLMKYFLQYQWYAPTVLPGETCYAILSQVEEENIEMLKHQEYILDTSASTGNTGNTTQSTQHVYIYNDFCYHVPVVELPDVDTTEINRKLYNTYYDLLEQKVFSDAEPDVLLGQMTYSVGRRGDIISVVVRLGWDYDMDEYAVHNFSATTGEEMTPEVMIRSYDGMNEMYCRGLMKLALERYWNNMQATMEDVTLSAENVEFFKQQRDLTLADSNIYDVMPMVAANGDLQFVGKIYSMAGADYYYYRFDQDGNLIDMVCPQHS